MKTKRLYILFVILMMAGGGAFNSCSSIQPTTGTENSNRIEGIKIDWLNIKCFQTLDNASNYSACLAQDDDWDDYNKKLLKACLDVVLSYNAIR
ncbi:MAG: hypothetical protein J5873_00175 [Bacteroidales bacterium]|nr:hypothetical protein [Bacteroidales bacterium]